MESLFLATAANILAAVILGIAIYYGVQFNEIVHVDVKTNTGSTTSCLFLGTCKPIDIDHCFFSPQIMVIVLAVGGILVADFTIWAFRQHVECVENKGTNAFSLMWSKLVPGSLPTAKEDEEECLKACSRRESSTLFLTAASVLCSAAALALFAPHKALFNVKNPTSSFPATEYLGHLRPYLNSDDVNIALSEFHVESAEIRCNAAVDAAIHRKEYERDLDLKRHVRIGDTIYPGLRTRGLGVNMASFNEYSFSRRGMPSTPNDSSTQTSSLLPDYKFQSLEASVFGTDIIAQCVDVTSSFITNRYNIHLKSDTNQSVNTKSSELQQFDISNSDLGIAISVHHQLHDERQVRSVLPSMRWEPSKNNAVNRAITGQYIVITDNYVQIFGHRPRNWNTTVFRCDYHGSEFQTNISMNSIGDPLAVTKQMQNVGDLSVEGSLATRASIARVLGERQSPLARAFVDMKSKIEHGLGIWDNRYYYLDKLVLEDILTDLAQAHWSLTRQQVETSGDAAMLDEVPIGLRADRKGLLRGTYTRIGGAGQAWLIAPILMFVLPIASLVGLLFSVVPKVVRPGNRKIGWQLVSQREDNVDEYADEQAPLPPPKDDHDPPPPYAVVSYEVSP